MKWREREKLEVDWDGRLYISNDVFVKFLYESVKKEGYYFSAINVLRLFLLTMILEIE